MVNQPDNNKAVEGVESDQETKSKSAECGVPHESGHRPRLCICGAADTAGIAGQMLFSGLLQFLHNHEYLKDYEPVVVSGNPERVGTALGMTAVDDSLSSLIQAASTSAAILYVGFEFRDQDKRQRQILDTNVNRILAGLACGVPVGLIGTGFEALREKQSVLKIADVMQRIDFITVRDQSSAIQLSRCGVRIPPTVAADVTFQLAGRAAPSSPTAKIGLALTQPSTDADQALKSPVIDAVKRLTNRQELTPVVIHTHVETDGGQPSWPVAQLDNPEIANFTGVAGAGILEAFPPVDVLVSDNYHLIIGAALCGIPSVCIIDNPALSNLAQQLRLGNYACRVDRMSAPVVLQNIKKMMANREELRNSLARAVQTKVERAQENLQAIAQHLTDATANSRRDIDPGDFIPELQPHAEEAVKLARAFRSNDRQNTANEPTAAESGSIPRRTLPDEPLVTIYMCAYNAGKWIDQALSSALEQTYRNLEILIVDDGSTDDTVARIRQYDDPRINLHAIEHRGLAGVRTYAKENFRGDLLFNLDADDWIAPELVAKQVALFKAHPELDVSYCDYTLVDADGRPTGTIWQYSDYDDRNRLLAEMFQAGCSRIPNGSMMERAEIVRTVGGYDPILKTAVDFEYLTKLAGIAENFRAVHEPLYFYRDFGGGHSGNYEARNFTVTTVLRRLWETYGGKILLGEETVHGLHGKQKEAAYLCRAADILHAHGDTYMQRGAPERFFELSAELYAEALRDDPYHSRARRIDSFYANQPQLDVLFEDIIPALLGERTEPVTITVLQCGTACDPYTFALEAMRRGVPPDRLSIRAFDSRADKIEQARQGIFSRSKVFNEGRNYLSPQMADTFFDSHPDGNYQLRDNIKRMVTIERGDVLDPAIAGKIGRSDIVILQTEWNSWDSETAIQALNHLSAAAKDDGYLLLGGYTPSREAAMAGHPELEPVGMRFEDIHNGWRLRRSVYGSKPYGLGPLDQRYRDWPRRFASIFHKETGNQHFSATGTGLKSYWMERGKIYKKQYPAKPIETQPVPYRMLQAIKEDRPQSILDYGCGFGKILREVRNAVPDARLVGLDISGTVLQDGYTFLLGGPPAGLVEGDGKTIPCLTDGFDVTFTHVTLIHVPHEEIRGVLQELVRVTRRTLYIGETADQAHESFYYFAHDYPALFAEMGLTAEQMEVPNIENQPGARLYRVDVRRTAADMTSGGAGTQGKRLLIVSDRRTVHTKRFCQFFRDQGHEVHLYDTGTNFTDFEGIIQHAPDPAHFPERDAQTQFYARVARLREVINSVQPDWVHGHFLIGWGWWAALASAGTPLALTAWGSDVFLLPREQPQVQNLTKWATRLADYVTADSSALARATEQLTGGIKHVELVPFGIDTDFFHPEADTSALRRKLSIPEGRPVVLSPRQIKPGANVEIILEAFARAREKFPTAILILKTYLTTFDKESEYMALIRAKISNLDLWECVRIVHDLPADQMPSLYALADVSLCVRDTDGTPCSLFESSAAGTPVIAGNIPSLAEWITDQKNGFLVPVKDVAATATAIEQALGGGPGIRNMKTRAREFAIEKGDYRRCFSLIDKRYDQPVNRKARCEYSLETILGRRTKRIEVLNAVRADLCRAIDEGNHEHGFRLFNTIFSMLIEADLDAVGTLSRDQVPQPV